MLAPMASRQSTWTCTMTRAGFAPVRTSISRGAAAALRRRRGRARAGQRAGSRRRPPRDARAPPRSSGCPTQLDLRGHHRVVRLGDEAAALAHHARGVRGRGDHRRLLDGHRHQVVRAVDAEVEAQPQRQRIDADHVLDHAVGGRALMPPSRARRARRRSDRRAAATRAAAPPRTACKSREGASGPDLGQGRGGREGRRRCGVTFGHGRSGAVS